MEVFTVTQKDKMSYSGTFCHPSGYFLKHGTRKSVEMKKMCRNIVTTKLQPNIRKTCATDVN